MADFIPKEKVQERCKGRCRKGAEDDAINFVMLRISAKRCREWTNGEN